MTRHPDEAESTRLYELTGNEAPGVYVLDQSSDSLDLRKSRNGSIGKSAELSAADKVALLLSRRASELMAREPRHHFCSSTAEVSHSET